MHTRAGARVWVKVGAVVVVAGVRIVCGVVRALVWVQALQVWMGEGFDLVAGMTTGIQAQAQAQREGCGLGRGQGLRGNWALG